MDKFLKKRTEEVEWLRLNGYENENPEVNGQYKIIDALPFNLFVDIGANRGIFSDRLKDIWRMLFEPNPELAANLRKKYPSSTYEVALAEHEGHSLFSLFDGDNATSSQFERTYMMPSFTKNRRVITVETKPLNSFEGVITARANEQPVFIKIDAEGAEAPIMRGARKILKGLKSAFVMFEYSFGWMEAGESLKDSFHLLDNLGGYSLYRITPLGIEKVRFFTLDMENYRLCNYLAVKNFDMPFKQHPIDTPWGQSVFYEIK